MNQCDEVHGQSFIANHQSAKVLQPRIGAFDNPAPLVTSKFPTILVRRDSVVGTRWDDRLNVSLEQQHSRRVAVVGPIPNQSFGLVASPIAMTNGHTVQCRFQQFHFRRGSLLHVYSERSTRAIGQYHKLCSLASFSLPDQRTPFFAVTNMPSIKHSFHRIFCRSFSWFKKARQRLRSTPFSAHWHSRRCTVLFEPYRSGNSLQGAPVHRIHRMPSKHLRSFAGGRPPVRERFRLGMCGSIAFHCLSVTCRQAKGFLLGLIRYSFSVVCQQVLG